LRIIRTGGNLPENREAMYSLDIKSNSSNNPDKKNKTPMLAAKAGFKLIYRPKTVKQKTEKGAEPVNWARQGRTPPRKKPTPRT
ncbi:fimbria/pilus periplasmic chaperone, partial [Salmonella enterica]|uniref:fimbria/pilus periplasmic chaperone n=1 Tax=Salmonella enterica TaxID=28901 RepID=UPI00122D80B9